MGIIPPDEVNRQYDDATELRARKASARSIAAIGSWDAEYELRLQERAYKSARKSTPHASGVSDSFPYSSPKHRKANTNTRKRLDFHGVCIAYKLRTRELYFYAHPLGYYFSAYRKGYITRGELDRILLNVKLMGEGR